MISTGGSLKAMEDLVALAGSTVVARIAVLAEGDAPSAMTSGSWLPCPCSIRTVP